jgi:hypothetical protein
MWVFEIFLPTLDNEKQPFPKVTFDAVRRELAEKFGGVTAFLRAPATGLWSDESGHTYRDELVIFEVMADALDRDWWTAYRRDLEQRFRQQEVLIRATQSERV